MSTAAVVVDRWKLPVFKRRLDDAGFIYTECPGPTGSTAVLKVQFKQMDILTPVIVGANIECDQCTSRRVH